VVWVPRAVVLGATVVGLLLLTPDISAQSGSERIIVVLNKEAGSSPASAAAAVEAVLADIDSPGMTVTYRYRAVPAFAAEATPEAIDQLREDARVRIVQDVEGHGADAQSGALINADEAHELGFTGEGVTIGVVDSGIDVGHPDFNGAILHEECFMSAGGLSSHCPNGEVYQSGPGAAQDDLGHGSNVAGILAGRGNTAPIGVAPAASLVVYKVIDNTNRFFLSDLFAALDDILADPLGIDILNLSLGTFSENPPGSCTIDPFLDPLRDAGIIVFASSMNQGHKNGMGYPACVDSVVSVGAVYDETLDSSTFAVCVDAPAVQDQVACWSNSDSTLDLLAPGCLLTSTGTGGSQSSYCGTSQASPHAAGGAALLLQQQHTATPDQVESRLKATGVPRTDSANGETTPRIDLLGALSRSVFGDVTCDFRVDGEDVAAVLSHTVGAEGAGGGSCPPIGSQSGDHVVGDVTCEDAVDSLDALAMLLYYAQIPQPPGTPECPAVGEILG